VKLYSFQYAYTRYLRTPTCGGMDSEPAGSERDEAIAAVIAPNEAMARSFVEYSHAGDAAFKIIGVTESTVHAIIGVDHGLGFRTRG
jgi:hypothetical protein